MEFWEQFIKKCKNKKNNMEKDFSKLEDKLDLEFDDQDLLIKAFIHRSYLNEHPDFELDDNERLEFLGDAVLELVVTNYLFDSYPEKPEGDLTNWRAALVNADHLSKVARDVGLNDFLLLSEGESKQKGKARDYILADVVEALLGAIYLDQGFDECEKFIKEYIIKNLPEIIEKGLYKDSKSLFQEKAQEQVSITPTYQVLDEWGPDHDKHFEVGVFLGDEKIAEGKGSSKLEAEEEAAEEGLKVKGW
ncbi:MAG: ribonuclease III [Candidatus Paceibacterota bacterium]